MNYLLIIVSYNFIVQKPHQVKWTAKELATLYCRIHLSLEDLIHHTQTCNLKEWKLQ